MKQLYAIMIMMTLLLSSVCSWAQEVVSVDSILADTDSVTDPEWYVAPIHYDSVIAHHAPHRVKAVAACPIDSILTYDIDSNLVSVTVYEYGDTTCTITWSVSADGSRIGQSKEESATTSTQSFTAKYTWDEITNDWKGTSKSEFVYSAGLMTTNTAFLWLNNAWIPNTRYTYAYDASNRETEYISYTCDETTNNLVPSKSRVQEWYDDTNKTLEILYTAHDGTTWSAGTKREYVYDAEGNQIEYTYCSSYSNGAWVNSTHEVWTYTNNQKTYYKKETWNSGAWLTSNEEFTTYDVEGQISSLEKYALKSGKLAGSMKEEYVYNDEGAEMSRISYKWTNNAWVKNLWALTNNELPDNTYETCNYSWKNEAWVGTGTRTLKTYNTLDRLIEQITQTWPTNATDWVNSTRNTTDYSGFLKIQEASYTWQNNAWKGINRTDYHYNAAKKNDTTTTFTYANADWVNETRVVNTYDAKNNLILVHNASWSGSAWTMTSMSRTDLIYSGSKQVMKATWTCASDSVWVGTQKDTTAYNAAGKQIYTARFTFNTTTMDWKPSTKTETEYDSKNRQTDKRTYSWDATKNDWKGTSRTQTVFDANGNKLMEATYNGWVAAINDWKGNKKTEKTFAANNLVSSMVLSNWNTSTNSWLLKTRYTYVYDNSKREILQTVENYTNNAWVNANQYEKEYKNSTLVKDNTYMWLNGQWVYSARKESYYDEDAQSKLRREITGSWSNGIVNTFTDNSYSYECDPRTIRFVNYDGTVLETQTLDKGVAPSYSCEIPTREGNAEYTYTFAGWAPELVPVINSATYTATFTANKNTYTITWKNEDGTVLQSGEVAYGETPVYTGEMPSRPSTAEYTYTFTGWSPEIVPVTGDATYTATFTATKNKYLITFKDEDGTILQSEEVEYGVTPTAPANPTKAATAEWTYTFAGWDKEIISVAEATTYTATYTATKNSYTITWKNDDGSIIESETLTYGTTPTHADINKESTAEYTYTFTGWTPQITAVTGDATYTALFDSIVNTYTVTFYGGNGTTILRQMQLPYGETPTISVTPGRIVENNCTYYSFEGWEPEIAPVTGNASYMPTYTEHYYEYMVTFRNYNRQDLQYSRQPCGFIPTYDGATPTRPGNAQYSYVFTGWTPELTELTGEAIYTATFEKRENIYTIIFLDEDNSELDRTEVVYGRMPSTSVVPTKEDDEEYTYTFAGWSPQLKRVTGDATYTATYKPTAKTEGINNAEAGETATKVIIDHQIFIRRGGNIYTIDGQRVQ